MLSETGRLIPIRTRSDLERRDETKAEAHAVMVFAQLSRRDLRRNDRADDNQYRPS